MTDNKPMTLEEFSKRCEAVAGEFDKLQADATDDEGDPHGVMIAILAAHFRYVARPYFLTLLN